MKEQSLVFTPEGIKRFAAALEELEVEQEEIRQADPKAEVSFFNERIEKMKQVMAGSSVSNGAGPDGLVATGSVVKLRDVEFDEKSEHQIVNRFEADPLEGKLSEESPLGRALMTKQTGDQVAVDGSSGTLVYEILAVK